jgi:ubiquinone/menaquinone biosynthesis C-methylase UbiE
VVVAFYGERFAMVPGNGGWEFPGGRIKRGETPGQAAVRELAEETGAVPERFRFVARGGRLAECALFTCELETIPTKGKLFAGLPRRLGYPRAEGEAFLGAAWRSRADYDEIAPYYDSVRGRGDGSPDPWVSELLGLLGDVRGKTIADAGCGTGRYALALADRGARVAGLDLSTAMLGKARGKDGTGRVCWIAGDAETPPLRDGLFDAVLAFLVIQHLQGWRPALAEWLRLLRPGGRLLVATTSRTRIRGHLIRFFPGAVAIDLGRFPGIGQIEADLRNAGYSSVGHRRKRVNRGLASVDGIVARFAGKHVSTLALVPEAEFGARLSQFERRLRRTYGRRVPDDVELTFIWATRARRAL